MSLERLPDESLLDFAKRRAAAMGVSTTGPIQQAAEAVAAARAVSSQPRVEYDDDLIPDTGIDRSEDQIEMDRVLGDIDIIDAYNRWCGKMSPNVGNRRESIMVSCPNPSHPDRNPSAWITLDKGEGGVGKCAQCGGFDKYDIAAWRFGYPVPGYKSKEDFPELRRDMAEDLGYVVVVSGKDEWLEKAPAAKIAEQQPPAASPVGTEASGNSDREEEGVDSGDAGPPDASVPNLTVVENQADDDDYDDYDAEAEMAKARIDWRSMECIRSGTFLDEWMHVTAQSFEPEEFYLWHGLLALAAACGNNVELEDTTPVRPNLMVCVIGGTGTGKSISVSILEKLIREALPWDPATSYGVRQISSPGSGEALLDQFAHFVTDPQTGDKKYMPVNGVYRENELAAVVKRSSRSGNTTREILMDLYDRSYPVSSSSRSAGNIVARDHFMQMVTSTQPAAVSELLTQQDAGAGYLNRWVFAFGEAKFRPARGVKRLSIDSCVKPLRDVRAWGTTGRTVGWNDDEAGEMWDKFYLDEVNPLRMKDDSNMTARLDILAKKLMLLFAINDRSTTILPEHVEAMMQLWPYLLTCYGVVEHKVARGSDPMETCVEDIMRYLSIRPGEMFTFRQICKSSGARKFPKEIVRKSLDLMRATGLIEQVQRRGVDRVPKFGYVSDEDGNGLASVSSIQAT